jgi:hypothetical protein
MLRLWSSGRFEDSKLRQELAEEERFELSEDFHPRWFSRPVHSTALPPLRGEAECYTTWCVRGKDKTASIGPQAPKCVDFARLTGMIIAAGHGWYPRVRRIEYLPICPH